MVQTTKLSHLRVSTPPARPKPPLKPPDPPDLQPYFQALAYFPFLDPRLLFQPPPASRVLLRHFSASPPFSAAARSLSKNTSRRQPKWNFNLRRHKAYPRGSGRSDRDLFCSSENHRDLDVQARGRKDCSSDLTMKIN
ncbi:unnamed protein product [Microthlaspi erraticum]|uniref:Uncharacterized protein n=1 Tax=Microthlaspi erraticum TaxID=1685480 RepID=A0A6D2JBW1_9BRAS|nr:unnamed protein product [Microthlaspi erraticum]CAA7042027.1 unnamed protein product [Microthlaspi erraticum]